MYVHFYFRTKIKRTTDKSEQNEEVSTKLYYGLKLTNNHAEYITQLEYGCLSQVSATADAEKATAQRTVFT